MLYFYANFIAIIIATIISNIIAIITAIGDINYFSLNIFTILTILFNKTKPFPRFVLQLYQNQIQ